MESQDRAVSDMNLEVDRELIRSIAGGSSDALGRLYDRHAAAVFGLACRVTSRHDLAEEVVQDVFAQVWSQAGRYDSARATVAGWLVMMTRSRALDRLRSQRARPDQHVPAETDQLMSIAASGPDPEQVAITGRQAGQVRAALLDLPQMQRQLVELAYYDGLTHAEIAERTGVPLGTVKTRLRAATASLRGALTA